MSEEKPDGRTKNNQSKQQRRAAVYNRRKPVAKRRAKDPALEHAKLVLRRTGREVFDARIDEPGCGVGLIRVDTRKMPAAAVIELAAQIEERERLRNEELRRQHGLTPKKETK